MPSGSKFPALSRKGVVALITLKNSALELDIVGSYLPRFMKVALQLRFLSQEK